MITEEHLAHARSVVHRVSKEVETKYLGGQEAHGGKLWEKAGIVRNAREEVLDLIVYTDVLKEQLQGVLDEIGLILRGTYSAHAANYQLQKVFERLDGMVNGRSE